MKEVFPYLYGSIINHVTLKEIQPLPLKSIRYLYEKTYLSRISDESMASSFISVMLSTPPEDQSIRVMRRLTEKSEYVLMDSTEVFSRSENVSFLEPVHNSKDMHLPQINVIMLFSATRRIPTFVRILPGSINDVTAISNTIEMSGVDRCVIVADKGFVSSDNVDKLKKNHLSYIIPLRRMIS